MREVELVVKNRGKKERCSFRAKNKWAERSGLESR